MSVNKFHSVAFWSVQVYPVIYTITTPIRSSATAEIARGANVGATAYVYNL